MTNFEKSEEQINTFPFMELKKVYSTTEMLSWEVKE